MSRGANSSTTAGVGAEGEEEEEEEEEEGMEAGVGPGGVWAGVFTTIIRMFLPRGGAYTETRLHPE